MKLTEEEKDSLKSKHKNERDRRIADRIKAVLLYDQGYGYEKIAEILLISHEGVRKYVKDYWDFKKLETNNGGRASKLSDSELNELEQHYEENNYLYTATFQSCCAIFKFLQYIVILVCKFRHV